MWPFGSKSYKDDLETGTNPFQEFQKLTLQYGDLGVCVDASAMPISDLPRVVQMMSSAIVRELEQPKKEMKYLFLTDCDVLELAVLQKEARDVGDDGLRRAVLIELGQREASGR